MQAARWRATEINAEGSEKARDGEIKRRRVHVRSSMQGIRIIVLFKFRVLFLPVASVGCLIFAITTGLNYSPQWHSSCVQSSTHASRQIQFCKLKIIRRRRILNMIDHDNPVLLIKYIGINSNSVYFNLIQSSATGIQSLSTLVLESF